jgi:hypothetical protein
MTTGSTGTKRRTLLQRGAALLAGGVALAGTTRLAGAASPPAAVRPQTLTIYARLRPAALDGHGRLVASGDLFDRPDGEPIGAFYANAFCAGSPFGGTHAAASNLAFHVLELPEGTLFSIGSGPDTAGAQGLAVIGGTKQFAGRSGSYLQRSIASAAGDELRELTITFA